MPFAWAEEVPPRAPALAEVVVTGNQTDADASRNLIAGKTIIGRERIAESGLQNVAELLKREPTIAYDKSGRIGLLGLPGYTQILVDGLPSTVGRGLSDINLVHVERIEIVKSTLAEFGPFSIAGTINIVTRQIEKKMDSQMQIGASAVAGGKGGANLAWSTNRTEEGSPLSFSAQVSIDRSSTLDDTDSVQTLMRAGQSDQVVWQETSRTQHTQSSLFASGTVALQLDARNTISFTPGIGAISSEQSDSASRHSSDGSVLDVQQLMKTPFAQLSLPLKWIFVPDPKSSLEVNWLSNRLSAHAETNRVDSDSASPAEQRSNTQGRELESNFLKLNYKIKLANGHTIKAGGQLGHNHERDDYSYLLNGAPDTSLDAFGSQRDFTEDQYRLFLQDDWRLKDGLAFNFGLSGDERRMDVIEGSYQSNAHFLVWSPSAHLAKKFDGEGERQLRISIAQSYKLPLASQLTLRPQINPLAPCASSGQCGANGLDTADTSGNPSLLPERALGINVSYEQELGAGSQVSIEYFARSIDRLIGTDIALENVLWANVPRYVARPANLGDALVQGVDVAMQLALRDFWKEAPAIELRGSVELAQSKISTLPGPDNRLADRLPWSAKIGMSYAGKDSPVTLSVDASWSPADWVRTNASQRIYSSQRFNLRANAAWKLSADTRLIFSLDNLLPQSTQRVEEYITNDEVIRQQTNSASHQKWACGWNSGCRISITLQRCLTRLVLISIRRVGRHEKICSSIFNSNRV